MIDMAMNDKKLCLYKNGEAVMQFNNYEDALELFDTDIENPSLFIAGGIDCRQGLTQMSDDDDYIRGYAAAYALQEVLSAIST